MSLTLGKLLFSLHFVVILQSLSHVRLVATPWTAACHASLSFITYQSLLKHISIESMMPSNHLILCCPLLLLPSVLPSIRAFSNESALHFSILVEYSYRFVNFVNLFKELALGFTDLFCFFFLISILSVSALIFVISFLLLTLGIIFFPSSLRCKVRLLEIFLVLQGRLLSI